ncbi:MAG: hypothetical protein VX738_09440 [Planctomycetota bacterium]|nr:hypothetical protein [Planctomycetota bacterium]
MRHLRAYGLFGLILWGSLLGSMVGCCGVCKSGVSGLSGRSMDVQIMHESTILDSASGLTGGKQFGAIAGNIALRGQDNGCGEFFWNSWVNDPPMPVAHEKHSGEHHGVLARRLLPQRIRSRDGCLDCGKVALEIHRSTDVSVLPAADQ